jgi:hypothetical protein
LPDTIAIIMDCDGTLCGDTTEFLLENLGIEPKKFWGECKQLGLGWDPPIRWMYRLLQLSKRGEIRLTRSRIEEIGKKIEFYQGIPRFFDEMREYVEVSDFDVDTNLEFYVITGGLEDLVRASKIGGKSQRYGRRYLKEIFGCNFSYDASGSIEFPRTIITFTEKTKYLYLINKGITRKVFDRDPYRVNDWKDKKERRVPFHYMIYIGDGPTDIPCLSAIRSDQSNKGFGIGVGKWPAGQYDTIEGRRIDVGPYETAYTPESGVQRELKSRIKRLAKDIAAATLPHKSAPRFSQ